ncbi:MAG: FapA family protein [bacterium]|jgi:uncharacterized protein (DUF342 family)
MAQDAEEKVVREAHEAEYDLYIVLYEDEIECCVTLTPNYRGLEFEASWLVEELAKAEVTFGLDKKAIEECCRKASAGEAVEDIIVARGKLPVPGEDGSIEFLVKPFDDTPEYEEDESGQMNFRETNLFENASEGQVIARSKPARTGEAGTTVQGKPIPVRDPARAPLRAGTGAKLSEDKQEVIATIDGRVIYRAGAVSVTEELVVDDVDLSTGHIDFVGHVRVRGDVNDGFNVRGSKGIRISGAVGHCRLESDGDIRLGGMNGLENEGSIRCGGNLTANYLHEVNVECDGDVMVKNEVMNCSIKARGKITIPGLVAGGEYIALAGIDVGRIGSESGVKTYFTAGFDYEDIETIDRMREELVKIGRLEQGLSAKMLRLTRQAEKSKMSDRQMGVIKNLRAEIEDIHRQKKLIEAEVEGILEKSAPFANPKINIRREMNSGAVFRVGFTRTHVEDFRQGSCSIIEHRGREIKFLRLTPLSKNGREVEEELLAQEAAVLQKTT